MQRKKNIKMLLAVFIPLILITCCILFYIWNTYYNKSNLLKKYIVDNSREVYILGTAGKKHFNRIYNYSMEDILSAIENVNPDIVLLTAGEENYKNFGIIDGDIDICVSYSYCFDNNIPVKFIDWCIVDNSSQEDIAADLRDDNIFIKISRILRELSSDKRIMIITGGKHFYEQAARFDIDGYKKEELINTRDYFKNNKENFSYPSLASKIWKDRTYFYAFIFPRLLQENNELFDSVKSKYIDADHDKFYVKQIEYCKFLNNNILYK